MKWVISISGNTSYKVLNALAGQHNIDINKGQFIFSFLFIINLGVIKETYHDISYLTLLCDLWGQVFDICAAGGHRWNIIDKLL